MVFLYIFLGLTLFVLSMAFGVFWMSFHSPNRTQNDDFYLGTSEQVEPLRETICGMIRELYEVPFEQVSITSFDGLRLSGRYYRHADGAPLAILFHGYRGTAARDFSGGALCYLADGFNVLLIEQRAHGTSEGHVTTFAVREQKDCLAWVDYARTRFGEQVKIVLCGISMGATTVLTAAGAALPGSVKGVIADSPFTNPKEIIMRVSRDRKLPPHLIWWMANIGAFLFGGFRLTGVDAEEAVRRASVPILIIHGEDDRYVPCDMGRRIAAANPERAELQTFPNAGHGLSFLVDRERYERITKAFLKKVLS